MVYRICRLLLMFFIPLQGIASVDEAGSFPAHIDIEAFGIYKLLETKVREFNANTTAGYASVVSTQQLQQTQHIALQPGVVFGFQYAITDSGVAEPWVPVTIRVHHPATENYLGISADGFVQNSAARLKADGRYHNGAFYILSEDYEMVPGEWLISVTYRDELVVSKRFIVE